MWAELRSKYAAEARILLKNNMKQRVLTLGFKIKTLQAWCFVFKVSKRENKRNSK